MKEKVERGYGSGIEMLREIECEREGRERIWEWNRDAARDRV